MDKPKAVLFDWDGTLYDSVKLCFEIYEELFERFGAGKITFEEFRSDFSGDYHRYQAKHGLGEKMWPKVDAAWYDIYYAKQDGAKLFSKTKPTLMALEKMGIPIGLVTNATKKRIEGELSKLGLLGYFGTVAAIEDAEWEFKPSPRLINIACEELRVNKGDALYIGDMAEDVIAGKRAGARTGVVATGVHTIRKLALEEPDFIFENVGDVLGVFV